MNAELISLILRNSTCKASYEKVQRLLTYGL
jgi:hypothetical protein